MRLELASRFAFRCDGMKDMKDEIMILVLGRSDYYAFSVVGSKPIQYIYIHTIMCSLTLILEVTPSKKCGRCNATSLDIPNSAS